MEEQKINEKESIELIASMISRTRNRLYEGYGRVFLLWGYVVLGVSALVWGLLYATRCEQVNWLWFLIWIIGGVLTPVLSRRQREEAGAQSYSDKICSALWTVVGISAIACTAVCLLLMLVWGYDCWRVMFVFALLIVGIIEVAHGIVVGETSLKVGGSVGVFAGIVTMALITANVPLMANLYLPLFVVAFVCMMIIPGHVLNSKSKRQK